MNKWIYRILKEDNFLSLLGNLVIAVFGFCGFALLVRSLSSPDFAQWVIFVSGGSLIEMFRYGITNNGLVRFLAGSKEEEREKLIGSNIILSASATLIILVLMYVTYKIFYNSLNQSVYALFFEWYPILAIVNLPWNNAIVLQQARMKYDKILLIRALNSVFFFCFLYQIDYLQN